MTVNKIIRLDPELNEVRQKGDTIDKKLVYNKRIKVIEEKERKGFGGLIDRVVRKISRRLWQILIRKSIEKAFIKSVIDHLSNEEKEKRNLKTKIKPILSFIKTGEKGKILKEDLIKSVEDANKYIDLNIRKKTTSIEKIAEQKNFFKIDEKQYWKKQKKVKKKLEEYHKKRLEDAKNIVLNK